GSVPSAQPISGTGRPSQTSGVHGATYSSGCWERASLPSSCLDDELHATRERPERQIEASWVRTDMTRLLRWAVDTRGDGSVVRDVPRHRSQGHYRNESGARPVPVRTFHPARPGCHVRIR